jgi:hypothetical protein
MPVYKYMIINQFTDKNAKKAIDMSTIIEITSDKSTIRLLALEG